MNLRIQLILPKLIALRLGNEAMRRPIVTLLCGSALACALLSVAGCAMSEDYFASLFDSASGQASQAADALQRGDADSAESLYTQALDANALPPDETAEAELGRGLAREKLGKHEDALADFTAAIGSNALAPADMARAEFDRGVALDALGRTPEAIAAFNQAITLKPDFAAAYINRGNAHLRLGDPAAAKSDYQAALGADASKAAYAWYGLGQVAQAQGDIATARECYEKALGVDPGYTLAAAKLAGLEKVQLPKKLAPLAPADDASTDTSSPSDASADNAPQPDLRLSEEDLPPVRQGPVQVQLGAFRDRADAAATWNRLLTNSGGLLDGLTPIIVAVDLPERGRFYRLRAQVSDANAAASLCDQLKSKGFECFAVNG